MTVAISLLPFSALWLHRRYTIDADSADWTVAERQIAKASRGTSTVVSVKNPTDKKRKHEVSNGNGGDEKGGKVKGDRKTRRSFKRTKR